VVHEQLSGPGQSKLIESFSSRNFCFVVGNKNHYAVSKGVLVHLLGEMLRKVKFAPSLVESLEFPLIKI